MQVAKSGQKMAGNHFPSIVNDSIGWRRPARGFENGRIECATRKRAEAEQRPPDGDQAGSTASPSSTKTSHVHVQNLFVLTLLNNTHKTRKETDNQATIRPIFIQAQKQAKNVKNKMK